MVKHRKPCQLIAACDLAKALDIDPRKQSEAQAALKRIEEQ